MHSYIIYVNGTQTTDFTLGGTGPGVTMTLYNLPTPGALYCIRVRPVSFDNSGDESTSCFLTSKWSHVLEGVDGNAELSSRDM